MTKTEAAEIARAIRAAAKEHDIIDVFTDQAGNFFIVPTGAEFAGRYNTGARAKDIAADVIFIGSYSNDD